MAPIATAATTSCASRWASATAQWWDEHAAPSLVYFIFIFTPVGGRPITQLYPDRVPVRMLYGYPDTMTVTTTYVQKHVAHTSLAPSARSTAARFVEEGAGSDGYQQVTYDEGSEREGGGLSAPGMFNNNSILFF